MNSSLQNSYLGPRYGKALPVYRRALSDYGTNEERRVRQRLAEQYDEARKEAEIASRKLWAARKAALVKALTDVRDGAAAGVQAAAGAVAKGVGVLGAGAVLLGGKVKDAYNAGTRKVQDAYKGLRALSIGRRTKNYFLGKVKLTNQDRNMAQQFGLNPNSTEYRRQIAHIHKYGREGGVAGKIASLSRKAAAGLQQAKAALGTGAGKVANFVMGKNSNGKRQTFRQRFGNVGAALAGLGRGIASRVGGLFGKRGGTAAPAVQAAAVATVAAASAAQVANISGSSQAAAAANSAGNAAAGAQKAAAAAGAPPSMLNRLRAFGSGITKGTKNIYQAGRNILKYGKIRERGERETSLQKRQGIAAINARKALEAAENANVAEKVAALNPPRGMMGRLYNGFRGLFTRKPGSGSGSGSGNDKGNGKGNGSGSGRGSSSGKGNGNGNGKGNGKGSRSGSRSGSGTKSKGYLSRAYSGLRRGLGFTKNPNVLHVRSMRRAAAGPQRLTPTEHLIANMVGKQTNQQGLAAARREGALMSAAEAAAEEDEEQRRFISNRAQSQKHKSMHRKGGMEPPAPQSVKSSNDIIASMMRSK